jgi:ribonuclease P protein component
MLPAPNRMRDSRDFAATVRRGRRAARPTLVVHLAAVGSDGDAQGGEIRVGLVVSRAVGSAVVRNRVKRRLRAELARRVANLPAGSRVVVRANPDAATSTSRRLAADLDGALRRLGVES